MTVVTAAEGLTPKSLDIQILISLACCRSSSRNSGSGSYVSLLSNIPVRDTPSRRSSSLLSFHFLERYLKSVNADWNVPIIAAIRTFSFMVFFVSCGRTTTSLRLQNCLDRRDISPQGLVPKECEVSLPISAALLTAATRLNNPLSPLLDS